MAVSVQEYIIVAPIILLALIFFFCIFRGMWICKLLTKRGFFLSDYSHLSSQSTSSIAETARVRLAISSDEFLDDSIRASCMEIVKAAEEYDLGVQIALAAWDDMMHPSLGGCDGDVEDGKIVRGEEGEVVSKLQRTHRRHVIRTMRERCLEGLEKRKRLSMQMKWMLDEMIIPGGHDSTSVMSGGLASPDEVDLEKSEKSQYEIRCSGAGLCFHSIELEKGDAEKKKPAVEVAELHPTSPHMTPEKEPRYDMIHTLSTKERNLVYENYRNFSLPSPTFSSFNAEAILTPSQQRRQSSPTRGQEADVSDEKWRYSFSSGEESG